MLERCDLATRLGQPGLLSVLVIYADQNSRSGLGASEDILKTSPGKTNFAAYCFHFGEMPHYEQIYVKYEGQLAEVHLIVAVTHVSLGCPCVFCNVSQLTFWVEVSVTLYEKIIYTVYI